MSLVGKKMATSNKALGEARRNKKDEFYTQLPDIENELRHYTDHFQDKTVLCNCDDPFESNFFRFFALNFNRLGLKKLIATCYSGSPITGTQFSLFDDTPEQTRTPYKAIVTTVHDTSGDGGIDMFDIAELFRNGENSLEQLNGDGDFRSSECLNLLKEADIVVTNPPFSLFREYIELLIKENKKFLIIGNKNAITYKGVFQLLMSGKVWIGHRNINQDMWLEVPEGEKFEKIVNGKKLKHIMACWYTNLDHNKRHEMLPLYKKYSPEEYPNYDNYDAIDVSKTELIPCDYKGVMGVPVTFFDKYCPEQFEILGCNRGVDQDPNGIYGRSSYLNGKETFKRIFIRNKHPEE